MGGPVGVWVTISTHHTQHKDTLLAVEETAAGVREVGEAPEMKTSPLRRDSTDLVFFVCFF